jgi:hypothetical protein
MLGIGNSLAAKRPTTGQSIVKDNLVLQHNYSSGGVHQVSTGAAYFVRSNTDSIQLGFGTALTPMATGFSACFWAKTNDLTVDQMALACDNGTNQRMYMGIEDGHYAFGIGDSTWSAETTNATTEWTHVTLTYTTGDVAQLYLNGVKDREDTDNDASAFTDGTFGGDFSVGRHGTSTDYSWDGYICNIGIWTRALTQAQIKSIMWKDYAGLTSSETTGLVSWWNLDSAITSTSVLDNHYGGGSELGSELVTNGSFTTDSDWNTNSNWIIDTTGGATAVADGSSTLDINQVITSHPVANNVYKVTFDVTSVTAGSVHFTFGGATGADRDSVGTYTEYITASNTDRLRIDSHGSNLFTGSVDNVSVKLVNGNTGTLS